MNEFVKICDPCTVCLALINAEIAEYRKTRLVSNIMNIYAV